VAVVVAEVLVDGGFQLEEVLLHCCSDGPLNYPGRHIKLINTYISPQIERFSFKL